MESEVQQLQTQPVNERAGRIGSRHAGLVAWLRLARLFTTIDQDTNRFLRQFDLSTAQFDLLAQVGAHEGVNQQDLAEALLVTKGNITQLLDRLEARGLIERRSSPGIRGKAIYLTEDGWRLNRQVVPEQEARIIAIFDALDHQEQQQLGRMIRSVAQSLGSPGSGV
jgi:DNA-binding MarR family transcriptional regulator